MTAEPVLTLVVAAAENGVIGRRGRLPWRIPSDLRLFRRVTMGKPVIMGRKTFQSIGKPLDGRANIVVTRDPAFRAEGAIIKPSLEAAVEEARVLAASSGVDEIMVIGGAEVFHELLPQAQRIYLTRVHGSPAGDTFLPALAEAEWREISCEFLPHGDTDEFACTFTILERKRQHDAVSGG